jgi:hypothetical protein
MYPSNRSSQFERSDDRLTLKMPPKRYLSFCKLHVALLLPLNMWYSYLLREPGVFMFYTFGAFIGIGSKALTSKYKVSKPAGTMLSAVVTIVP